MVMVMVNSGASVIKVAQTEKRAGVDTPPSSTKTAPGVGLSETLDKNTPTKGQVAPSKSQRWVPPTARENLDPTEVSFRKIRGILNKLTPDNFEKLSREFIHHACNSSREIRKGAIVLVFDKALDESSYSFMYAQLCLRLNDYAPIHSQSEDQHPWSFRKLLLHKCQEEFQNRRRATADLESRCGEVLSPEEEEQMAQAKRKMLGNIKFVGELYKIGVLHEAIIHSCIKELLERRRGQSVERTSQSVECLCHFMTTVGSKLDISKAKSWMDKYFARMQDLSSNKELPSRIRFMLLDVIELRKSKWVPRRVAVDSSPRPIYLIRHEVYQEKQGTGAGGRGHGGHGGKGTSATPPSSLDLGQPEMRGQSSSQYSGVSGDEGFTSSPYMQDTLSSPQDHTHMSFASHPAPPLMHTVMTPSPSNAVPVAGTGKVMEKKKIRKLSSKADNTVSLRPAMQSLKIGSSSSRNKLAGAITPTSIDHALLQPDSTPEGDLEKAPGKAVPVQKMHIPRTRDDSSDEEDQGNAPPLQGVLPTPPPMVGHIHMPPRPFPGGGNFPPHHHLPPHHHHLPPPHMMHPQQQPPHLRGSPGVPEPFHGRGPRGLIGPGPPPLPHAMGNMGQGLLPHQQHPPMMYVGPPPPPGSRPLSGSPGMLHYPPPGPPGPPISMGGPPRGYFPPQSTAGSPGHPFLPRGPPHIPGHVPGYGQMPRPIAARPSPGWNAPGQEMPRPSSNPAEHDGEKHSRPPNLERNEPVIKYKSSSKKSGGTKKGAQDEKERIVDSLIKDYLRSRDMEKTVEEVKGQLSSIPKDSLCALCITKTLEKSEDDRTHMSGLLQELHTRGMITSQHLLQALTAVINSSHCGESQNKMYLAGFIARAVAKDLLTLKMVCPLFDQGAHHPTILVLLQALTALLGEVEVLQRFKASDLNLTMLLPLEFRSHSALSNVMESKHLSFLYPLKRIQSELAAKLKQEADSALPIYRWIRANVDSSLYPTTDFVMILSRCILEHVTSSSSLCPSASSSDTPSKDMVTKEKDLMEKFKVLIQKFVSDKDNLQVSVLYATQVFCHDKQFPKGLLLRIFSYWYDMDVIEEESFFKWKEDVPQEFPGKGQALFQVNQWLVLLAESDDEEASSDEES